MPQFPIYQVDAFSNQVFRGNPAAVVIHDGSLSAGTMQSIALENNLAETAFVREHNGGLHIRWFTPTVEVDLCGHATLAAAHVYFAHRDHSGDSIVFDSKSGELAVVRKNDLLALDFPTDHLIPQAASEPLTIALGASPSEVFKGRSDLMAVFETEEIVVKLQPNLKLIAEIPARGVIATAIGNKSDFVSRFFAPQSGIPEDPVTGSAHTSLTPYWSRKLSKNRLHAIQLSLRGGELVCENRGDRSIISGSAVTYLIGEITI